MDDRTMTDAQKIPWKRLSVEALAIVASILLAFTIDAWWNDRQRVSDERILLQSLLEDLNGKKQRLANDRKYNEAILQAVVALLQQANDPNSAENEDTIDLLIGDTWWYNTESEWDSAPMASLIGGDSAVVSNPALLQKLAELQVQMARIRIFYRIDANFHHNTYTPYLVANAYMPQITRKTQHHPGRPELAYQYPRIELQTNQDHSQLIRQKEFQNMMIAKMDRLQDILQNAYRFIDEDLDEAIALLKEELAN